MTLAWVAVFPGLKTVIRLDSSEHLTPATMWSEVDSSSRRDLGVTEKTVVGTSSFV